jgi:hypothetical protein
MAAFITRTQDSALRRASKRAALDQFWTTTPNYLSTSGALGTTTVGTTPELVKSDGTDVWVANRGTATVSRVRASDGKLLDTWTSASGAFAVLAAMGLDGKKIWTANLLGSVSIVTPTMTPPWQRDHSEQVPASRPAPRPSETGC